MMYKTYRFHDGNHCGSYLTHQNVNYKRFTLKIDPMKCLCISRAPRLLMALLLDTLLSLM